jgi:ribosomal protein S18 acetylase RimI-like enzyme
MFAISSEDHNIAEISADLAARLTRFNESHAGPLGRRHVALTVRNESNTVIAGLTGEFLWNGLYVHLIWVDAEYRHQGYGSQLLRRAEALASEASSDFVYLSTFEFQAPGFYQRHGYSVIGELRGVPAYSGRLWFAKTLSRSAKPEDRVFTERWEEALDALVAAPAQHRLLFENAFVRVLDTRIAPGERTPLHTHRWPAAHYIISWSDFVRWDANGSVLVDSRTAPGSTPPEALWGDALAPHSLENVGVVLLHIISTELKS